MGEIHPDTYQAMQALQALYARAVNPPEDDVRLEALGDHPPLPPKDDQ